MTGKNILIALLICGPLFFIRCSNQSDSSEESSYRERIREWRAERLKSLKSPDGWLNLAGLYWLDPGKNTVGSDSSNDVVFPDKAPENLGTLFLSEEDIRFNALSDAGVYDND